MPLEFEFIDADTPESKKRLQAAYGRIFAIAKQNIITRRQLEQIKKER